MVRCGRKSDTHWLHRQLESVITRAHAAGVSHQLVIATDIAEAHAAIEPGERFPDSLYTTVGVHPHEADNAPTDLQSQLFELAQSPFVKAIGECGLILIATSQAQQIKSVYLFNRSRWPMSYLCHFISMSVMH